MWSLALLQVAGGAGATGEVTRLPCKQALTDLPAVTLAQPMDWLISYPRRGVGGGTMPRFGVSSWDLLIAGLRSTLCESSVSAARL